ncbi:DNA/RNA polymerases superfamily protein [Gossypium australe]|uniref:DNA/RNA polymerases superfamily protein n=1 Tax=Gossypium australe TaxID=47621 RepID=A0A5B6VAC3_9ROSI|nr:DNA/RNA polymerases superfamily protein [Gossypium australe]
MDFVLGLPQTPKKKDAIWVVVDRLTKSAHFIPVRIDFSLDRLAELYIFEIVGLHRVSVSTILDRDPLLQSSIKMAPYEALYGRKCRTLLYWTELSEKKIHGVDLIRETEEKVKLIRDSLKAASDRQKSKIESTIFRPYEIIERTGPVAYRLELPSELEKIHNVFHVSMSRRYRSDPSHIFSPAEIEIQPDMSYNEEPIKIFARDIKELRKKSIALVKVLWQHHGVEKATWEPEEAMRKQ